MATIADAGAVARIHVRAWRAAYQGVVPDRVLEKLTVAERTERWTSMLSSTGSHTAVFEQDGEIHGWLSFGSGRDADCQQDLEIFAIYIDPDHWRRGTGRALVEFVERHFAPYRATFLWVLADNAQARRFYEATGFSDSGTTRTVTMDGATLIEQKYHKAPTRLDA